MRGHSCLLEILSYLCYAAKYFFILNKGNRLCRDARAFSLSLPRKDGKKVSNLRLLRLSG